jgi:hypothetical protein
MTTSLQPNLHAVMRNVKDYTLESGTKFRWARNTKDGITLQEELVAYIDVGKPIPERHHLNWHSVANVHKPKRGNRFVVEVRGHTKLFSFPKLREAMRMAKFLYQTRHNI